MAKYIEFLREKDFNSPVCGSDGWMRFDGRYSNNSLIRNIDKILTRTMAIEKGARFYCIYRGNNTRDAVPCSEIMQIPESLIK